MGSPKGRMEDKMTRGGQCRRDKEDKTPGQVASRMKKERGKERTIVRLRSERGRKKNLVAIGVMLANRGNGHSVEEENRRLHG